jgi:DNA polymerase-3 subunit delta'
MTVNWPDTVGTHGLVLPWHRPAWHGVPTTVALPQALLVAGPEGSGLPLFALALVQARLCQTPDKDGIACGACRSCEWFAAGHHPDVLRIGTDVASNPDADGEEGTVRPKATENREEATKSRNIPVADIRRATAFLQVAANSAAGRFVILSPADGMNAAAGNALLKVLEEPPTHTTLVLVSARESRLLPTVRSRCQVIRLPRPEREDALRWVAGQGVGNAALAMDLAGQAPLSAAALDSEFWTARGRLVGALARADGDPQGLTSVGEVLPLDLLLSLLHTWVCDCLMVAETGRVRYHTDQTATIARSARRQNRSALIAFEQRLREARRLVDHPLNTKLLAGDLLLAYAACEQNP